MLGDFFAEDYNVLLFCAVLGGLTCMISGCFVYYKWKHYKSKSKDPFKMRQKPKKKLRNFLKKGSGVDDADVQRNRDLAAMSREAENNDAQDHKLSGSVNFDNAVFSMQDET